MLNHLKPSKEVPDAIDDGLLNFRSVWALVPEDAGTFQVGSHTFTLDEWRFRDGLTPVTVTLKAKRVRIRLQLPTPSGTATVVSLIFGGGWNNTALYQNKTEIEAGLKVGSATLANPHDSMFHALHSRLSVSLPEVAARYGSLVGLGLIEPHYVPGASRAMLDWPETSGAQLIHTVLAVMVEGYNQFVAVARAWEETGDVPSLPPP